MLKLWVQLKPNNAIKVASEGCQDIDDLIEACTKEVGELLGPYDSAQLSLSLTNDGTPLRRGLKLVDIPSQYGSDDEHPLFITMRGSPIVVARPLVGRVMKVCINQSKLMKKYLTPVGSTPSTPPETPQTTVNLSSISLKLDNPMFNTNSSYRYCIVVDCQPRTVELLPPVITIVLITSFDNKPLDEAIAKDDFKRVMPISPTVTQFDTASPLFTTPEWTTHPKHSSPSYVLCIPIKVNPENLDECEEEDATILDTENLQKLKLHLLSLGGIAANPEFVDSDEEEEDDDIGF